MNEEEAAANLRLLADCIWSVLEIAANGEIPDQAAFHMANGFIDDLQEFLIELRELSGFDIQHGTSREHFESIIEQLRLFADDLG